jgi:hypothetical protein
VSEFREDQRTTTDPDAGADEVVAPGGATTQPEHPAAAVAAQRDGRAGRPS